MTTVTTCFHLLTAAEVLKEIYDDETRAKKAAKEMRKRFPGCFVRRVVTTVETQEVYRSRVTPTLRVVRAA